MGRTIVDITVTNALEPSSSVQSRALVDTGASALVLPESWKDKLGPFERAYRRPTVLGDRRVFEADYYGPVRLDILGFEPVHCDAMFLDLAPEGGSYLPILGYVPLQSAGAAVDMLNHQLLKVPLDLRSVGD